MLSSEMATVLTGRYLQIEMLPFSLEETMSWKNISLLREEQAAQATMLIDDYMRNGGYLETISARSITKSYLSTLFDSILLKDITKRHNIRNTNDLYNLASYLLSNFCNFSQRTCRRIGAVKRGDYKEILRLSQRTIPVLLSAPFQQQAEIDEQSPQKSLCS